MKLSTYVFIVHDLYKDKHLNIMQCFHCKVSFVEFPQKLKKENERQNIVIGQQDVLIKQLMKFETEKNFVAKAAKGDCNLTFPVQEFEKKIIKFSK